MICIYYEGILFLKAAPSRIGKHSANAQNRFRTL